MADIKNKLNGGIDLLAKAMRQVFDENMAATREAIDERATEREARSDEMDKLITGKDDDSARWSNKG